MPVSKSNRLLIINYIYLIKSIILEFLLILFSIFDMYSEIINGIFAC